jgi:DoxX-like family
MSNTPGLLSSRTAQWTGRVLFGLVVVFLAFDGSMKLSSSKEAIDGTMQLGYPAGVLAPIAVIEAGCLLLLLIPRTAPFGALLWTAYFGGAVATHVRVQNPLFSHILFPVYIATTMWLALYILDARVRTLVGRP